MPSEHDSLLLIRKGSDDDGSRTEHSSVGSATNTASNLDGLVNIKSNIEYYQDGGKENDHGEDDDDNRSAIGNVVANLNERVVEFVEHVQVAVVDEANQVAETLMDELHDADGGDLYFFDMGLTRNLSILPSDVVEAANARQAAATADAASVAAGGKDEEQGALIEKPNTGSPRIAISAYILLAVAVVSLSFIGPFLQLQGNEVSPIMKIIWRMMGTAIVLTPFAARDVCRVGFPQLTRPQWITFLLATFSYVTMGVSFVVALGYTSVGNCVILSNSLALILLVGKICVGDPVSVTEGAGAIVAFLGAV